MRTAEKASARARHQRAAARDVQNDGHQQGRSGRSERVPRNVPAVRTGKGQLQKAGAPASGWQQWSAIALRWTGVAFAQAIDRRRRRGFAAGL